MKINIHITTYIFLLISFLAGYFEYMFLLLLIVFIHEMGHLIFSMLIGVKKSYIILYPFGGISIINEELNIKIYKELFILIGGLIFQLSFFFLTIFLYDYNYITTHVYIIIKTINFYLISFNFMPIIPLDGGRLLNTLLDIFFGYKNSIKISIIISIIFTIIFIIFHHSYFDILLFLFLIKSIIIEINNINLKYNKFLYERYINNYNFKRIKYIKNKNSFKRDFKHVINGEKECVYLYKLFDRTY